MGDKSRCGQPAAIRIFWPGQAPMPVCPEHHLGVMQLAQVLGFHLHFENVPGGIAECRSVTAA